MGNFPDRSGVLDGKDEISEYLGGAGRRKLETWIAAGMPVRIGPGGRMLAHKDNIEKWFRIYTSNELLTPADVLGKDWDEDGEKED